MLLDKQGGNEEQTVRESLHLARYAAPESKPHLQKASLKSRFLGFGIGVAASLLFRVYFHGLSPLMQDHGFWIALFVFTAIYLFVNYRLHGGE